MLVRVFTRKQRSGSVPVYLNVYDVTPINGYAYWLGLGVYHSGIEVHGVEYAYGAHDHPTTGIFEVEPRRCPGFRFRKPLLVGRTDLGPREVRSLMDDLAANFTGITYHLITKNCNHFCNEAALRLTGEPIPRWVNRLASLGFFCNCVLPVGLHVAAVTQKGPPEEEEKGKVKLIGKEVEVEKPRSKSGRSADTSSRSSSSSSSCSSSNTNKNAAPPSSAAASPPPPATVAPVWRRRGRLSASSSARAALVAKA